MYKVLERIFEYHSPDGSLICGRKGAIIHVERRDEADNGVKSGAIAEIGEDGFIVESSNKKKKRGRPAKKKKELAQGAKIKFIDKEGEIRDGIYEGKLNNSKAKVSIPDEEGFVLINKTDIEVI